MLLFVSVVAIFYSGLFIVSRVILWTEKDARQDQTFHKWSGIYLRIAAISWVVVYLFHSKS